MFSSFFSFNGLIRLKAIKTTKRIKIKIENVIASKMIGFVMNGPAVSGPSIVAKPNIPRRMPCPRPCISK